MRWNRGVRSSGSVDMNVRSEGSTGPQMVPRNKVSKGQRSRVSVQ